MYRINHLEGREVNWGIRRKSILERFGVWDINGTDSELCPIAGVVISGVKPECIGPRVLVTILSVVQTIL
jgi:hypothetical protein